jgi:hypothetical protein
MWSTQFATIAFPLDPLRHEPRFQAIERALKFLPQ